MDCLSWNICGLGAHQKVQGVRNLVKKVKAKVLGLQETKIEVIEKDMVTSVMGMTDCDYAYSPSDGASGGLLLIWESSYFVAHKSSIHQNFLGVVGKWRGISQPVAFVNVYAPQNRFQKNALWNEVSSFILSQQATVILFGDFNVVRSASEKIGCNVNLDEANDFNLFIHKLGLIDVKMTQKRFTRFNKDGSKMSRLDRFLVSANFLDHWRNPYVQPLERGLSDHSPIFLQVHNRSSGPKPFKCFDCWLGLPDFELLVKEFWFNSSFRGTPDVILKNKLKGLKEKIRLWNKGRLEAQRTARKEITDYLEQWDALAECGLVTEDDVHIREGKVMDLCRLDQMERETLKQKARVRWAIEGDENSKFFHATINKKLKRQEILGMNWDGMWIEEEADLKIKIMSYFEARFKEPYHNRPHFHSSSFNKLTGADRDCLEVSFSEEEIKNAVWDCGGSKAPGPDGFNFNFLKRFWEVIKVDFIKFIRHFEQHGSLQQGCNASFIVLIPKKKDSLEISEYRPISLIGCMYKVLAKLLSNRLAKVIHKVISQNQTGFISGRQIMDGCLMANEIVDYAKHSSLKIFLLKVDFEKAFDSVSWKFLLNIMKQMGFGPKFCKWIEGCLNSASVSILVNGSPSKEFKMERGLRQGDPLSPFLFLIAAEALQIIVRDACDKSIFDGIFISNSNANISLLQYADDALFFGGWAKRNVEALFVLLDLYNEASGLKINIGKSMLFGVGVGYSEVASLARSFSCKHGVLPFPYLGVPVGSKLSSVSIWKSTIAKFTGKLNSWNSRLLSCGGRLSLIKSVLNGLPVYLFSLFKAPSMVIKLLEGIRRKFFWGSGVSEQKVFWIAWKQIIASKEKGGLGIGCLKSKNLSLLGKWFWRFNVEEDALWRQLINALYGESGGFNSRSRSRHHHSLWTSIIKCTHEIEDMGISLSKEICRKIGNGNSSSFWHHKWNDLKESLCISFPRLFALESRKECVISDRWKFYNGTWIACWDWRSAPRGRAINELHNLEHLLYNLKLEERKMDTWIWKSESSGKFRVSSLHNKIQTKMYNLDSCATSFGWNSLIPSKVNIGVWKAAKNKLATGDNLLRKGILSQCINCYLCGTADESLHHLIIGCPKITGFWRKIWSWWQIHPSYNLNLNCLFSGQAVKSLVGTQSFKVISGVIYIAIWLIWNWRNRIRCSDEDKQEEVRHIDWFPALQNLSYLWIESRCRSRKWDWTSWLLNPRAC